MNSDRFLYSPVYSSIAFSKSSDKVIDVLTFILQKYPKKNTLSSLFSIALRRRMRDILYCSCLCRSPATRVPSRPRIFLNSRTDPFSASHVNFRWVQQQLIAIRREVKYLFFLT